jgi:hypothetical protein
MEPTARQGPSETFESLTITGRPNETSTQFSPTLAELFRHSDVGSAKVTTPPIPHCGTDGTVRPLAVSMTARAMTAKAAENR